MRNNKLILSFITVLTILNFMVTGTVKADADAADKDYALKAAAAINGFVPHYVAPGVKQVAVDVVYDSTVQYTYVLEEITKNSPKLKDISRNLKDALIKDLKNNSEVQSLRENKINLIYLYKDKNDKELFKVKLNAGEY